VGLAALLGVGWLVHRYGMKDPVRERFKEGIAASGAVRQELGKDCNLTVDVAPQNEEQVVVTVRFSDPPQDMNTRRELVRSVNIIVRRFVHSVRELKVVWDDTPEVIPSWDGGVAVAGTPEPIGVRVKPPGTIAPDTPPPAVVDAGTPQKVAKTKMGSVTLVTFPDADVFRGAAKLGRTPLFNAELPVGTHMLTLVGADGAHHRLSLPVKAGKNKPLKVKLDELPMR